MQEPRGEGDPSEDVVHEWVKRQAQFVKGLNSYNLLTTGFEGFFGQSTPTYKNELQPPLARNGTDPLRTHRIPEIDVYCFHLWASHWFSDDVPWKPVRFNFAQDWLDAHYDLASRVNKPAILEEWGADTSAPRVEFYSLILVRIEQASISAGDIIWLLGGSGEQYAVRYVGDLTDGQQRVLQLFEQHARRMVMPSRLLNRNDAPAPA